MDDEADRATAWAETGGIVPRPGSGAPSTQHSGPSRLPAAPSEIATLITPCLTLVAPAGMDEDQQTAWFAAAMMALVGFSGREIAAGVGVAMRKADHPAKVVPAIVAAIENMAEYSRDTGRRAVRPAAAALPAASLAAEPLRLAQWEVDEANARFRRLGLATRWQLNDVGEVEDAPQAQEAA